jgi:hypothetical protein
MYWSNQLIFTAHNIFDSFLFEKMIKLVMGPNSQWHSKMMTKIKYFLGILAIIFISMSTNHYFPFDSPKKAAFTSRNISLDTREGLLEPPKPIKLKNPPIAPQLTSEYAVQETDKGKQSNNTCKIMGKN